MDQIPLCNLAAGHAVIRQQLDEAIAKCIDSSAFILGEHVDKFEELWARECKAKHCVAVSNCTDAMFLAIRADKQLRQKEAEIIAVPAMTVTADAEAVTRSGNIVAIRDVDENGQIVLDNTAGFYGAIVVHLHGHPHPKIREIRANDDLFIIEDCAHAHGAPVGHNGYAAAWSFFPSKVLGAMGDAGAVTTDDDELAKRIRALRNHGRHPSQKHEHEMSGYNMRMDGLQAAILNVKLETGYFRNSVAKRRRLAKRYCDAFGMDFNELCSYYVFAISCEHRDQVAVNLKAHGIQTGQHYPVPLNRQPFANQFCCPNADHFAAKTLSLPLWPEMPFETQDVVIKRYLEAINQ